MDDLKSERDQADEYLIRIRNFIRDLDSLSYADAFVVAKSLRDDVGKFLEDMSFINLIDRTFLMYVGYPRCIQSLDDIGISNMELLLLNVINICDGTSLSLEDTLKLLTMI